jgi:hypothetical protein
LEILHAEVPRCEFVGRATPRIEDQLLAEACRVGEANLAVPADDIEQRLGAGDLPIEFRGDGGRSKQSQHERLSS